MSLGMGNIKVTKNSIGGIAGANYYKKIEVTGAYVVANDITHVILGIGFGGGSIITLPNAATSTGRIIIIMADGGSANISPAYKYLNNVITGTTQRLNSCCAYISDGTFWQMINLSETHDVIAATTTGEVIHWGTGTGGADPINNANYSIFKKIDSGTGISVASDADRVIISSTAPISVTGAAATSGAVTATILTITPTDVPVNRNASYMATIAARRVSDNTGAAFHFLIGVANETDTAVKRIGLGVNVTGFLSDIAGVVIGSVTAAISGNNTIIQVTGVAAMDINWTLIAFKNLVIEP